MEYTAYVMYCQMYHATDVFEICEYNELDEVFESQKAKQSSKLILQR